jgi:hypothetical protein
MCAREERGRMRSRPAHIFGNLAISLRRPKALRPRLTTGLPLSRCPQHARRAAHRSFHRPAQSRGPSLRRVPRAFALIVRSSAGPPRPRAWRVAARLEVARGRSQGAERRENVSSVRRHRQISSRRGARSGFRLAAAQRGAQTRHEWLPSGARAHAHPVREDLGACVDGRPRPRGWQGGSFCLRGCASHRRGRARRGGEPEIRMQVSVLHPVRR